MWDCLLEFLARWQTFIVGFLGFVGVIVTLWMNAALSRRQHERQIEHERTALRTALCSELEVMHRIFEDRAQTYERSKKDHTGAWLPEYVPNQIYSRMLDRIGLLTTHEIKLVIDAYMLGSELPTRLRLLNSDEQKLFDRPGYVFVTANDFSVASNMHKNFLIKIEEAIESLKVNLKTLG